jgi:hypothetical protein
MGILDLDSIDVSGIKLTNAKRDEVDDDTIAVYGIETTRRFNPNSFGFDGSVMANQDVYDFAEKENEVNQILENRRLSHEYEKEMNNEVSDIKEEVKVETKPQEYLKEELPFKVLPNINPICKEIEIPHKQQLKAGEKSSPLILVSKNDSYQVVAYNIETRIINSDSRISKIDPERKPNKESELDPANFIPFHIVDYEFNLMKRSMINGKDIVITRSDGTRNVINFSDDICFNTQRPLGILLKEAMYNYAKVGSNIDPVTKSIYNQTPALVDAIKTAEIMGNGKLVFRREYCVHYDEADVIIKNFINKEYDIHKDTVMYTLGMLLKNHPYYIMHNGEGFDKPYTIKVAFDTIVDVEKHLPSKKTNRDVSTHTFVIPWLMKAFHIGSLANSLTWNEIYSSMNENIRKSLTNFPATNFNGVTIVKQGDPKLYYYKVGNEIHSIWSTSNDSRPDGIYLYDVTQEELSLNPGSPFYKEPTFIALDDASANGFYSSKKECELDGNVELHVKHVSSLANLEASKTSLLAQKENQIALKNKSVYIDKEEKARARALEIKLAELEKKMEAEKIKNYYEERSYDRKDTTETLKFLPTVIGGVVGVATAMGALSIFGGRNKFSISNIVLGSISAKLKGYLAIIGGVYAISEILGAVVKKAKEAGIVSKIYEGGKSVVKGVYEIGKSIVGGVYEAGKSVVRGAYYAVKDTFGAVGGFLSDCFSW